MAIRPLSSTPPAEPGQRGDLIAELPTRRRLTESLLRRAQSYALPGLWVALAFACVSFTPSLLPRAALFQGLVTGLSAVFGYGVGVFGAWLWRAFARRGRRKPRPFAWRFFVLTAALALALWMALGQMWQSQLRELMGMPRQGPSFILLPVTAALVFALVVSAARGLRSVYLRVATVLERWLGPRTARALGLIVVAAGTWLIVSGVFLNGLTGAADLAFTLRNDTTADGVERPTSPLRSGGPGSLVPWETLGRQGRAFTSGGPSAAEIAMVTGAPAAEPIRAFAGTDSAADTEARAELAVDDLERAGGFDRSYLLVATTTGSGRLSPDATRTLEYLTRGDCAIVAIQYSHLPSWLSYLVDVERAAEAGRELFDAVYERWSALPTTDRPQLLVFGESLGAYGSESAFSGEADMAHRIDGALFAGPPSFNMLFREFTEDRDEGSPQIEPVFRDGQTVRFTATPDTKIRPASQRWSSTRVLYLLHPSDPIVWWHTDLLVSRPDWLEEPAGRDVLDAMVWIPFVTFWQVTADTPVGLSAPAGHGHNYGGEYVDAWANVLQLPGWTDDRAATLREIITGAG